MPLPPPLRAPWPLVPRPAVLPCPAEMPRPTRLRDFFEPSLGPKSLSFISPDLPGPFLDGLYFFYRHQMADLVDHPPNGRCIFVFDRFIEVLEAECLDSRLLTHSITDRALAIGYA